MAGKTPRVIHEKRSYRPGSKESLVYRPAAASEVSSLFLIATGFGGTPDDYRNLARYIAAQGATAIIPDCNAPPPDCTTDDPLEYRSDTLSFVAEDALDYYGLESLVLVGHSYGDACQAHVVGKAPGDIIGYVSLMGQGYEHITLLSRLQGVPSQIGRAVLTLPRVVAHAAKQPHTVVKRLDKRRWRELKSMLDMEEGHNLPFVEQAKKAGAACVAIVGPNDRVISAEATRRIASGTYGTANIRDAHPNADHFAPQTHARRIARLVFESVHGELAA